MVIKQDHMTMAVIAGSGSFSNGKLTCAMQIDSVWIDTTTKSKINTYRIPMWTVSCAGGTPDTIYADLSSIPTLCNADTLVRDIAGVGSAVGIAGRPVLNSTKVPTCPHSNRTALDGDLIFVDTVTTLVFEQHVKKVSRVDTFSHTDPIKWVKGTVILNLNGTDTIVHGFTPEEGKEIAVECGTPPTLSNILGGTILPGPAVLLPGEYTYNSYSQDSTNYCWGTVNIEYKLWPKIDSRKDTISCVDVTAFDRSPEGGHYNYVASTNEKLEDVCKWAEQIYTGGSTRVPPTATVPGIGAMRSIARVTYEVNKQVRHCYTHTVTTKDRYIKDFNWLCDTVVKERSFIADKQDHDGSKTTAVLVKDTLMITPISLDEVHFPDSLIVMKCGILEGESPEEIAEYLYKAYEHFNHSNTAIITGQTTGGASGFTTGEPCELFASQYNDYELALTPKSSLKSSELWEKVFKGADYNNWGVKKAFPYAVRRNKLTDNGLKNKLGSLILAGDVEVGDGFTYGVEEVLIPINKIVCNIAATHHDLYPINACGGEKKIFRQWTLVDWCTGTVEEKTQIIKFVDNEAPAITSYNYEKASDYFDADSKVEIAKGDSVLVRSEKVVNPWGCTVPFKFPELGLKEHCSTGFYKYKLLNKDLVSDGNTYQSGQTVNLTWNNAHGFEYPIVQIHIYDECGNESKSHFYLKGLDKLPPVVVLHDNISVTLTADKSGTTGDEDGIAKVFCADVDAGSHDGDCGPIKDCKIRIQGTTEWLDGVHFGCEDVGEQTVEFLAEDMSGNTSIGWALVTVENKISATLICENVTIDCTDPIHPDWLGYPHVSGICAAPELEWEDVNEVDDLCYKGRILRTWTVVGSSPKVTCVQTITIDDTDNGGDNSLFDPKTIKFPLHHTGETLKEADFNTDWISVKEEDAHGVCRDYSYDNYNTYKKGSNPSYDIEEEILKECSMNDPFTCDLGQTTEPTWTDPACGLVGKTFEDQVVNFGGGVCFKILRRWAVIDWCTYDPKKGDEYEDQIEFVKDYCEDDSYFRLRIGDKFIDDGYYAYTQEIKILDDMPPVVESPDFTEDVAEGGKNDDDCIVETTVMATAKDFCGGDEVEGAELSWTAKIVEIDYNGNEIGSLETVSTIETSTVNGEAKASYTFSGMAGSIYRIKWTAVDGCNNRGSSVQKVTFADIKAPVLLCIRDLSTNVMNTDGTTEIWSNDFGEAFDCDGDDVEVWFKDADGNYVPNLTFTCDDLDGSISATIDLQVFASDAAGNESFCEVRLRIIDSNGVCPEDTSNVGAAIIAGEVRTHLGDMVESAKISLAQSSMKTSTDGLFAFEGTPMGLDYQIQADKADDYLNGVSTLDLVLIQKHILGLQNLDSPYKVIASDINNDENVSAIDLVELRKLILGLYDELPNNASWRFADARYQFIDENNPFPFTESIDVNFLAEDRRNENFIAIKVGDVSGNAIANSLIASGRNNESITLTAQDAQVRKGEKVKVAISSEEFSDMNALQYTMSFSGLDYQGIEEGVLKMNDENIAVFEDRITAAWYDVNTVSSNDVLFTLVFRATENTTLSNAISIGSGITTAQAYRSDNEGVDIALAFETGDGFVDGSTFELFQNKPNPFENITTIGFQLAEAGAAKVTVFDVTGKIVSSIQGQYSRGYNEITVSKSDLGTSGVLYYQLESGDFTATRKMILID